MPHFGTKNLGQCEGDAVAVDNAHLKTELENTMVKNDIQVKEELVEQILGTLDEGNVKHDWLEGLLYARYGFINNPRYEEVTKKVLEPKHVMGALAEKQYRFEVEEMGHGIIHFVSSLANAQVPEEQWDLCEKNPAYVLEIHKPMFRVQRYKFADNSWGYALTPVKTRLIRSWQIVVRDAMAVIQCVRCEWGPSLEELAAEYVRIGIPFQTLMSVAMDRVQWRDTGLCPSVPRRSKDFKATQEEYDIYVHRRDQLLSQPRARAAALAGGILWRFSREALEHRRDVPLGPSKEVTSYYGPTAGEQSGTLDDTLTEDEIKILHGMYYVETGNGGGDQVTHVSWWPSPDIWKSCGLDVGYWTSGAEAWFQKRLEEMKTGKATVESQGSWRSKMRFYKKNSCAVIKHTERMCADVLQHLL